MPHRLLIVFLASSLSRILSGSDLDPKLSADEIMKQVAANQDREQKARESYLYSEHVRVIIRRSSGKLSREESSDLIVTPEAKKTTRKVQSISGRYWKNGHYKTFSTGPVAERKDTHEGLDIGIGQDDKSGQIPEAGSLDGSLARSFREDLTSDSSKDGMGKDLFPLTTDEQKDLKFELVGEELVAGRNTYRIRFGPRDSHEYAWAGEALIDKEEYQPVSVYTRLSRRLPLFVRAALGTDVPGLGFNVQYKRVDKDVWFPVSFGTEFRIHAVFFINRNVSVSLENKDFKRLSVNSDIHYGESISSAPAAPAQNSN